MSTRNNPILSAILRITKKSWRQTVCKAWSVLTIANHTFNEQHAAQAAAGLAYYALFSVFPLLLFLIAVGSLFVTTADAQRQIEDFITNIFPISQQLVVENLDQVLQNRGTIGVVAGVSLLWSASGFFVMVARNISRAWSNARLRSFLEGRLLAAGMVIALAVVLFVAIILNTALNLLPLLDAPFWQEWPVVNLLVQTALSNLVPGIISFLLFLILYRQVPRVPIGWREAAVSAVAAAVAWRLASIGFVWYLRSGLVSYNLVYGSLGSLAALLFWIYWSGWILLFGAHLCSAIAISERVDRMAACAVVDQEEDTEESS